MYIIGFIFIFIGLSLLLYTIIIFFTNQAQNKKIEEKINNQNLSSDKSDLKKDSSSIQSVTNSNSFSKTSTSLGLSSIQLNPIQRQKKTELEKGKATENFVNSTNEEVISKSHFETQNQIKDNLKNLDLLITGYFYYDTTGTTDLLLEKQEKTPSEILSNLIRLGNATLEWSLDKFIFNFSENQILLNLKDLKEVRFIEDCAIFIPIQKKPYYYFFSKQIQELKNFLSNLTVKFS